VEYPKKIIEAIAQVRDSVETVQKDGVNAHFGYRYVTERGIQAALRPLLKEAGLVIIPSAVDQVLSVDSDGNFCYMASFTLCHVDGDVWPEKVLVPAQDKGDKAPWKANTGAMKYLLNRLFMLDTGDDPEGEHDSAKQEPRRRPAPQRQENPNIQRSPQSGGGRFLTRSNPLIDKKFWGKAFGVSEAVHGKDKAMRFTALDRCVQEMGYKRLDNVPEDQFDELCSMLDSYQTWWNDPHAGDDDAPPF